MHVTARRVLVHDDGDRVEYFSVRLLFDIVRKEILTCNVERERNNEEEYPTSHLTVHVGTLNCIRLGGTRQLRSQKMEYR